MNTRIQINVDQDLMQAQVCIRGGEAMDEQELRECCRAGGVAVGFDDALVAELGEKLSSLAFTYEGEIARGSEAVPGEDGRIEFEFPLERVPGRELPDGGVNFHEQNLLQSVSTGTVIGRRVAPVEGVPGTRVDGSEIPAAPVESAEFGKLGQGVRLVDDNAVAATRDGVLVLVPNSLIDVVDFYEHDGDVDLNTGDLNVRGSIDVRGDVAESYRVTATDNVVVRGTVSDACVEAGVCITLLGGAMGKLTVLTAEQDVICRHASRATLRAGGEVRLTDHGVDCRVYGKSVTAEEGRGQIVASEIFAREGILVLEAGNEAAAQTILRVADTSRERRELLVMEQQQRQLERQQRKRGGAERGGKVARAQAGFSPKVLKVRREIDRVEGELLARAEIMVRGTVHAGVRICFGPHQREINAMQKGVRFTFDVANSKIIEESISS